jgi:uncharacterized protein DUF2508
MRVLEYFKERNGIEVLKGKLMEVYRKWKFKILEEKQAKETLIRNKEFVKLVNEAKEEWKNSKKYFEEVSDPDLIDLAIHRMEATKIFYMIL